MATTAVATQWKLQGRGYEFCNCDLAAAATSAASQTRRMVAAAPSWGWQSIAARAAVSISLG